MEQSIAQLRNSQYLRAMLDSLSDMIRVVTREGKIAFTNKSYDKRMAYGTDSVGTFCYELYGQNHTCEPCITQEVMRSGRARQVTRHLNGRVYSMMAAPLPDENGKISAVMEIFRDITLDVNIRDRLCAITTKMSSDLHLAQEVQESLVRRATPDIEGYSLYAHYLPCEMVGGDMCDVIVADEKMVLYVADASGHGVTPSMLGVFFARSVHGSVGMGITDPAQILAHIQQEFQELNVDSSLYITAFVLVIDIPTGHYSYSNGGLSVVPVHYHAAGGEVSELFMSSPPVSRWFVDPQFGLEDGQLAPGDRIFIYSDGIGDVQVDQDALDRMYAAFAAPDYKADDFALFVIKSIRSKQNDDLTMLICERQPDM